MAPDDLTPIGDVPRLIADRTGGTISPSLDTIRDWCRKEILDSRRIAGRRYVATRSIDSLLEGKDQTDANPD